MSNRSKAELEEDNAFLREKLEGVYDNIADALGIADEDEEDEDQDEDSDD